MKIFIYRIYFPESDKCYIGQTSNLQRRLMDHVKGRFNSAVYNALQKYDDWKVSILHTCNSNDEANRVEIEEIRNFNSVTPNGYNLTRGGESVRGFKWTEEQRANASRVHKGKQIGKDNPMFGKKRPDLGFYNKTPEHRAIVSKVHRGRKKPHVSENNKSPEMREKFRISKLGKKRGPRTEKWTIKHRLSVRRNYIKKLEAELQKELGPNWEDLIQYL